MNKFKSFLKANRFLVFVSSILLTASIVVICMISFITRDESNDPGSSFVSDLENKSSSSNYSKFIDWAKSSNKIPKGSIFEDVKKLSLLNESEINRLTADIPQIQKENFLQILAEAKAVTAAENLLESKPSNLTALQKRILTTALASTDSLGLDSNQIGSLLKSDYYPKLTCINSKTTLDSIVNSPQALIEFREVMFNQEKLDIFPEGHQKLLKALFEKYQQQGNTSEDAFHALVNKFKILFETFKAYPNVENLSALKQAYGLVQSNLPEGSSDPKITCYSQSLLDYGFLALLNELTTVINDAILDSGTDSTVEKVLSAMNAFLADSNHPRRTEFASATVASLKANVDSPENRYAIFKSQLLQTIYDALEKPIIQDSEIQSKISELLEIRKNILAEAVDAYGVPVFEKNEPNALKKIVRHFYPNLIPNFEHKLCSYVQNPPTMPDSVLDSFNRIFKLANWAELVVPLHLVPLTTIQAIKAYFNAEALKLFETMCYKSDLNLDGMTFEQAAIYLKKALDQFGTCSVDSELLQISGIGSKAKSYYDEFLKRSTLWKRSKKRLVDSIFRELNSTSMTEATITPFFNTLKIEIDKFGQNDTVDEYPAVPVTINQQQSRRDYIILLVQRIHNDLVAKLDAQIETALNSNQPPNPLEVQISNAIVNMVNIFLVWRGVLNFTINQIPWNSPQLTKSAVKTFYLNKYYDSNFLPKLTEAFESEDISSILDTLEIATDIWTNITKKIGLYPDGIGAEKASLNLIRSNLDAMKYYRDFIVDNTRNLQSLLSMIDASSIFKPFADPPMDLKQPLNVYYKCLVSDLNNDYCEKFLKHTRLLIMFNAIEHELVRHAINRDSYVLFNQYYKRAMLNYSFISSDLKPSTFRKLFPMAIVSPDTTALNFIKTMIIFSETANTFTNISAFLESSINTFLNANQNNNISNLEEFLENLRTYSDNLESSKDLTLLLVDFLKKMIIKLKEEKTCNVLLKPLKTINLKVKSINFEESLDEWISYVDKSISFYEAKKRYQQKFNSDFGQSLTISSDSDNYQKLAKYLRLKKNVSEIISSNGECEFSNGLKSLGPIISLKSFFDFFGNHFPINVDQRGQLLELIPAILDCTSMCAAELKNDEAKNFSTELAAIYKNKDIYQKAKDRLGLINLQFVEPLDEKYKGFLKKVDYGNLPLIKLIPGLSSDQLGKLLEEITLTKILQECRESSNLESSGTGNNLDAHKSTVINNLNLNNLHKNLLIHQWFEETRKQSNGFQAYLKWESLFPIPYFNYNKSIIDSHAFNDVLEVAINEMDTFINNQSICTQRGTGILRYKGFENFLDKPEFPPKKYQTLCESSFEIFKGHLQNYHKALLDHLIG